MNQKDLKKEIKREIKKETMELLEETKDKIIVYDYQDSKEICFQLNVTKKWVESRIWCNPKFLNRYKFDKKAFVKIIYESLDKEAFSTLNHIFFIYQPSDIRKISQILFHDRKKEIAFDYSTCYNDLVGQLCFEYNCIFINVKKIEKLLKEFDWQEWELKEFMIQSLFETCFHELRHLWLDTNPFISEEKIPLIENSEENVEYFARSCYYSCEEKIKKHSILELNQKKYWNKHKNLV